MAYLGQFDRLIPAAERGKSIMNTRTIAVFNDALVICAVSVYGDDGKPASGTGGLFGGLRRTGRARWRDAGPGRGDEHIRMAAQIAGSGAAFAPDWPKADLIPFAVIDTVALRRPQQVSELTVELQAAEQGTPERLTFLGDLSADAVRAVLGPPLGDRLRIEVAG